MKPILAYAALVAVLVLLADLAVVSGRRRAGEQQPGSGAPAEQLAPPVAMPALRCGAWEAVLATPDGPRGGFVVVDEAMLGSLVADWEGRGRPEIEIRLPGSTNRAGVAVGFGATNRTLVASVRLNRTGAAAFMGGRNRLDAKFECDRLSVFGPLGRSRPAVAPARLRWLELTDRPRFHRED